MDMIDNRPSLKNREAFENVLSHYHVSDRARQVLSQTALVVLNGVAGGGRNTVINHLVRTHDYEFIVSDTTRPPKMRDGRMEVDGVNYFFRREEDLLDDLNRGEFVEAELIHDQQVSGTSIREIERIVANGKIPIGEAEFGGVNAIAEAKPDAVVIGLLPPSFDEWMRRLSGREEMHEDELANRLRTAEKVFENMLSKPYFKFVINDEVEHAAETIHAIVNGNGDRADTERAQSVAQELLRQVRATLAGYEA